MQIHKQTFKQFDGEEHSVGCICGVIYTAFDEACVDAAWKSHYDREVLKVAKNRSSDMKSCVELDLGREATLKEVEQYLIEVLSGERNAHSAVQHFW